MSGLHGRKHHVESGWPVNHAAEGPIGTTGTRQRDACGQQEAGEYKLLSVYIFTEYNPNRFPFCPVATILSPGGAGSVRGERVDHLSVQQEEAPPAGGPLVVLWGGGNESLAAAVPQGPPEAALVPLQTHNVALPHQHLSTGGAV